MELKDVGDAWNSGYNKGDEVGNKVSEKAGGDTSALSSAQTATPAMNSVTQGQVYGVSPVVQSSVEEQPVVLSSETMESLTTNQKETYSNSNNTNNLNMTLNVTAW